MRTNLQKHAPISPKCALALIAVCVSVPGVSGQGPNEHSNGGDSASYAQGSKGLYSYSAQELPAKTASPPTTAVASITQPTDFGMASLPPETQGDLLMLHQRYLAAVDAYRRGPQNSPVLWNKLGIAYQHMYALDFAKLQYEKALSLDPRYSEALNNLGTVYYGEKDYKKAEKYYKKAMRLKSDCASYYSNIGTAYFAEHKYKQGLWAYQRAFDLDPQVFIRESMERIAELGPIEEQARLNYELAKIYASAGNFEAAIRYLRNALIDGFDDRKKLMTDKEFAKLREQPQFALLMAEEHLTPN
jgi:tetratricopeptide (TPR) repeat protein